MTGPKLPLRTRLSLWYTLSLSLILLLFATFLYLQLRRSLLAQIDTSLQLAAAQILINLDEEGGQLAFQNTENNPEAVRNLNEEFVIYLLATDGTVWQKLGRDDDAPTAMTPLPEYETIIINNQPWRVYNQIVEAGHVRGWVQVMRELDLVEQTLGDLLLQMVLAVPMALVLAGVGGYWLAARALRPIDRMTNTAQSITANELSQRIGYSGPADEVGRLAQTFDTMLARLQDSFTRERRFTGDAAHELRTPLTALKGRIGVTLSRPRTPTEYTETLQEMEGQVDRLIRLSSDLLFMARLDQGPKQRQFESIALADFMGAVVDQIRPLAQTKAITLLETIPENITIQGDMDLLIRLFLNLLDNAIKYTPGNGRVVIRAQQTPQTVQVAISDTGPGIPPEHVPHLFERFYRVGDDRARQRDDNGQAGAGLGLAIAYEIARAHGGMLLAHSEIGQGTTFTVQLPLTKRKPNEALV